MAERLIPQGDLNLVKSPVFRRMVYEVSRGGVLGMPNGGIRWKTPGDSPELNFARAVANVQILFSTAYPEFDQLFPRNEDLLINEPDRGKAKKFVADRLRARDGFRVIGMKRQPDKNVVPQFNRSIFRAVTLSFGVYGLEFDHTDFHQRPEGYWTSESILAEASQYFASHGSFSNLELQQNGLSALASAIHLYYPGKWRGLLKDLGIPSRRRLNQDWDKAKIEAIARDFLDVHGGLSKKLLLENRMHYLLRAIEKHYDGGLSALKSELGVLSDRKSKNYWNEETILDAARSFVAKYGRISQPLMRQNGASYLPNAISQFFPGGWQALMERLGPDSITAVNADSAFGDFFEEN